MNLDKQYTIIGILLVGLVCLVSCEKKQNIRLTALPEKLNAEMHFRGFVTDENEELVSQIYNFSKVISLQDTINGQPVWGYISNGKKIFFYTDENGTVWEKNVEDIAARLITYGFSYELPMIVSEWEILLKVNEGIGTEWKTSIDTVFDAKTNSGELQKIHYIKQGQARYDGISETFVPELYENVQAHDAYWYDLKTLIINEATGDTLFATKGNAHQYFHPELGSIKYISNFTKSELNQENVILLGTWELMRKEIPE